MNFVADESCARPVILALREAGHDVIAIAEVNQGSPDDQVLERALNERRVLITEDRDFGELVLCARPFLCRGNPPEIRQQPSSRQGCLCG